MGKEHVETNIWANIWKWSQENNNESRKLY